MGYKRVSKNRICCIITLLLVSLAVFFSTSCGKTEKDLLRVSYLKVGKADAIILENDGRAMVIDTGEDEDGEEIADYLKNRGIDKVEAVIITHFDKDHVGGADTLFDRITAEIVYLPDYEGEGKQYREFTEALKRNGLASERLRENLSFDFGACKVLIEPPLSYEIPEGDEEYDNNFSLITTVTHGENRFIFTGDAESERLSEWLSTTADPSCTVLKMPHHGKYDPGLPALLKAAAPQAAVLCTSEKNPAEEETLLLLSQQGIASYQTKDGDIRVTSDGNTIDFY